MTISLTDNNPRISYTVNSGATQTSFTVPFEFFDIADLNVYVDGTKKTATTHYSVASGGSGATGTINLSVTGISGNSTVVITRDIALARTTDFPTSGAFNIAGLNTELDKVTAQFADRKDDVDRSLRLADDDTAVSMELPDKDTRKGKYLAFNASTGVPEAGATIADVALLSTVTTDIAALADIEDGTTATDAISGLAAIKANVTTVAGIASNVTTVAGIASNVTAVAGDATDIGAVAGKATEIGRLGTADAVSDLNTLGTADAVSDMNTLAAISANISTVAGVSSNVTTVAGIDSEVTSVAGKATELGRLGTADAVSDMNTLGTADAVSDMNTLAGISSNITTVAGVASNVTTVAGVSANVTTVAGISSNVTTVAGQTTNLQNVTDNLSAIQGASGNATAAAQSAAAAASALDSFDDRYLGSKTSNPTVDNDGNALVTGALYFNSSANEMRVYDGANWVAASSAGTASLILYEYTATSNQTSFSGSDDNSASLSYSVGNIQVVMNGVILDPSDFTATSGTSVVLASGATTGDLLNIYAFKSFTVSDTVSASAGGTFAGNVTHSADLTVSGKVGIGNNISGSFNAGANNLVVGSGSGSEGITIYGGAESNIFFADGTATADNLRGRIEYSHLSEAMKVYVNNSEAMRIISSGNVGIGTASPSELLDVYSGSTNARIQVQTNNSSSVPAIEFRNTAAGCLIGMPANVNAMTFTTADNERMRVDSSGNLHVGKTTTGIASAGLSLRGDADVAQFTRSGDATLELNRLSNDGDITIFYKDSSSVGSIGCRDGFLTIYNGDTGLGFDAGSDHIRPISSGGSRDNAIDLGRSATRFDDIFATNGTIQTSDSNEKQQIASLTDAEITAAKAISALFKTFKWNNKVEAKGDAARTHTGVIAQEVQTAMGNAGLDAADYAFWCSDTWWETSTDVPAVEADEEAGIEAQDAYTRIDTYSTADEAPDGATQRTRMGIRYPELLAFIGAATEQRLASIETRLTALEAE